MKLNKSKLYVETQDKEQCRHLVVILDNYTPDFHKHSSSF